MCSRWKIQADNSVLAKKKRRLQSLNGSRLIAGCGRQLKQIGGPGLLYCAGIS
jgi:hypothetical protein